jgi:hypothetical protein
MCDRTGYGLSRVREPHGIPVGTGDPPPPNEGGDPDRHRGLDLFITAGAGPRVKNTSRLVLRAVAPLTAPHEGEIAVIISI